MALADSFVTKLKSREQMLLSRIPEKYLLETGLRNNGRYLYNGRSIQDPQLGDENSIRTNLDELRSQELTTLDMPDPELTYLFKHIFTQQVAYESLLYSTRAMLHETIGGYIEREYHHALDQQGRRQHTRRVAGDSRGAIDQPY